jgi:hypothetical protein
MLAERSGTAGSSGPGSSGPGSSGPGSSGTGSSGPGSSGTGSTRSGLQIQISKLLLASIIAAIATSVAMIVATVMIVQAPTPPPPPPGAGPPPPSMVAPIVTITVITGMFVVSWLAVVATLARDQVLRRLRDLPGGDGAQDVPAMLAAVREELAADRRADLAALEARLTALTAEYGEQRETDGYVNGMRVATRPPAQSGDVRPLHRR